MKKTIKYRVNEKYEVTKIEETNEQKSKKNFMKYLIVGLVIVFFVVGILWPGNDTSKSVLIKIKDYGEIEVKLDPDNAPITVENFIKLVNDKFYDGLTFHRVIKDFMIQGGDPNGDGTGGSKETIKGEFSSNGITNRISHKRGVISMARSQDNNSASSQFFIMHKDNVNLDGNYAAFGEVTRGIDVVDKIVSSVSEFGDDNGLLPKDKQPIIETIRVLDK